MSVDLERLKQAMVHEAALLHRFEGGQNELLEGMRSRNWSELERRLDALGLLGAEIEQAERERMEAAGTRALDGSSFARSVAALAPAERVELEGVYHELNLAVIRVKASLSRLGHYVGAVMGTLDTVLGELLPHRKGRIYSAAGAERRASGEAIVLDRRQ